MSSDWKEYSIDDLKSDTKNAISMGPFGSNIKRENFISYGVPVIRGGNLNDYKLRDTDFVYVSEEKKEQLKSSIARSGDIIITHRGTLGQVGIIPKNSNFKEYIVSQSQMKISLNKEIVLPEFIFYFFKSQQGQEKLLQNVSQTGVPAIASPTTSIKSIVLKIPPKNIQKKIVEILEFLTEKIELNNQINQTLESMARAIFKAWFIDFEPVHAKQQGKKPFGMDDETAALFPDRFEESELGLIPKGWGIQQVKSTFKEFIGGDWGKDSTDAIHTMEIRCLRGADIPAIQLANVPSPPVRFVKHSSLAKRTLQLNDLVVEISGGSPTQSTGRTVLVERGLIQSMPDNVRLSASNFCRLVRASSEEQGMWLYFYLRHAYDEDGFFQWENGTTGIKNFAFSDWSEKTNIVNPPLEFLKEFSTIVSPLMELRWMNGFESSSLTKTRELLLSHLLSGELKVQEKTIIL